MNPLTARVTAEFAAPVADTWRAIVDSEIRVSWWSYLQLDPRMGGAFEELWRDDAGATVRTAGSVVAIEALHRLELDWADDSWPASTRVVLTLDALSPQRTRVSVEHTGWEALVGDVASLCDVHESGWRLHLENWARAAAALGA